MVKRHLQIIIDGENPHEQDNYNSLNWKKLGDDHFREVKEGGSVIYQYFHNTSGKRPDMARAIFISDSSHVEKIAYIQDTYSEDFDLQKKLNKLLGIRVKPRRR